MKTTTAKTCVALLAVVAVLAGAWHATRAQAQPAGVGAAKNFTSSEYFDSPYERQIKWQITGAEARPEGKGRFRITSMKLQMFNEKGERQIVVEAPECLYDQSQRTATSDGPLQVQSGDGRFQVKGKGFRWQQSDYYLTISNQVQTVIQGLKISGKLL